MRDDNITIATRAYDRRVRDLMDDGYRCQFDHRGAFLLHALLVHHNGNRVHIHVDAYQGTLEQRTNHIVTHSERLWPQDALTSIG